MRKRHLIRLLPLLALLVGAAFGAQDSAPVPVVGRLGFFIGDVHCRAGAGPWSPARLDQPLVRTQELRTGAESRAELLLGASVVRLGEHSVLSLADLSMTADSAGGGLNLLFGRIWSRLRDLGGGGLELRSPTAVMAVRGTTFRAEADRDSSLSMWVYEGRVEMGRSGSLTPGAEPTREGASGGAPVPVQGAPRPVPGPFEITLDEWVRVTRGMRFQLRPDGRYALERFDEASEQADEWVKWNLDRDAAIDE